MPLGYPAYGVWWFGLVRIDFIRLKIGLCNLAFGLPNV